MCSQRQYQAPNTPTRCRACDWGYRLRRDKLRIPFYNWPAATAGATTPNPAGASRRQVLICPLSRSGLVAIILMNLVSLILRLAVRDILMRMKYQPETGSLTAPLG